MGLGGEARDTGGDLLGDLTESAFSVGESTEKLSQRTALVNFDAERRPLIALPAG